MKRKEQRKKEQSKIKGDNTRNHLVLYILYVVVMADGAQQVLINIFVVMVHSEHKLEKICGEHIRAEAVQVLHAPFQRIPAAFNSLCVDRLVSGVHKVQAMVHLN